MICYIALTIIFVKICISLSI